MNAGGWEYLLPWSTRRRWLCMDAGQGATTLLLAGMCDELHVIPSNRAARSEIAEKLQLEGVTNTKLAADGGFPDPGSDGFDGFILHDVGGVLARCVVERALQLGTQRVLPDGFVYVGLRNRYGYTRLRRAWSEIRGLRSTAYFSAASVRGLLGRGRKTTLYPLISDEDGQITEMVPAGGYLSAKNPSLATESLRRWFLGRHAAPRWSPAFALVATGDHTARSGLERALDTLESHGCLKSRVDVATLVKRYHVVNGGKAIVSIGTAPGKFGSHIAVLVRSTEFVARRRHESEALMRIAALPGSISSLVPRFYYEERIGSTHVFVLQEFPGVTLDTPGAGLHLATEDAARFLMRLHSATRKTLLVNFVLYEKLFGAVRETMLRRYPVLAAVLARLETSLRERLLGSELPVVFMHGDFKIENVVVDEDSFRLLGIIDWELAETEGLPLLDLWYLFLYNRQIERGVDFLTAAQDLLPPQRLTDKENALYAEYVRELNFAPRLVPAFVASLILHHAARRMEYAPSDVDTMKRIRILLEKVVTWIDGADSSPLTTDLREAASNA